ncbi:MAG TPA: acetylglutamate kinase [Methanomassiliicoccales archaeon]|nr:acetylglutamate kinase [Methanomassiliicoccales archaeon]
MNNNDLDPYPKAAGLKGKKVVIKFGGSSIEATDELDRFCRDVALLVRLGINPVIVHGGGPEITAEMKRRDIPVRKVLGLRITDDNTLEVAKSTLTRINDQIVRSLNRAGLRSIGIAGSECNTLLSKKMAPIAGKDDKGAPIEADLGWVGEVVRTDPKMIDILVSKGFVPVIYPIGADERGQLLNINADTAAAHIAQAVKAEEFVLVTDVPGLMRVFGDPSTVIPEVRIDDFAGLVEAGVVKDGMIPKLEACVMSVRNGVKVAHMVDGKDPEAILGQLLTPRNFGTRIIQ